MERVITTIVESTVVPMSKAVVFMADHGLLLLVFAVAWVAFGAALVLDRGSLDAAWRHIGQLPLLLQGVIWLLFLPVVAGLWVWESSWPFIVRLVLVLGLGGWNLLVMLPRSAPVARM